MFSRIESWIYRTCRYIHLRLQKVFILNHIISESTPPDSWKDLLKCQESEGR